MRRQSVITLVAAVFIGLIAVFLVNSYLTGIEKRQVRDVGGTVKVGVARVPLGFGTTLSQEKVRFVDWPRSSVPPGALQSLAQMNDGGKSRVVLKAIETGEPILHSKLSGPGGRATLSNILPTEKRAVAISVNPTAGVAGFVLPGDRVDVMLTRQIGEEQVTDVLLQDVRVAGIDQSVNDKKGGANLARTATLELDTYDAQKVVLASQVGSLNLALRSTTTPIGPGMVMRVRTADLGSGFVARPARPASHFVQRGSAPQQIRRAPPPPSGPRVDITRGTATSNYEVSPYVGY